MRTIQFNRSKLVDEVETLEKPVINIIRAVFSTDEPNWVQRLISSSLTLKTVCFGNLDNEVYSDSRILVLSSYITPNHKQPVLEINHIEKFQNPFLTPLNSLLKWKTTIELNGAEFKQNETLSLSLLERSHIQRRVANWESRINQLYSELQAWLSNNNDYTYRIGHPTIMHEDLMRTFEIPPQNVNTFDVLFKQKIILAFKPKGLWIIGANGRIDIISSKGSFMLVDLAEPFESPQWFLYTANKKSKNPFTQQVFEEVLSIVQS
jgi:hypothetical protein